MRHGGPGQIVAIVAGAIIFLILFVILAAVFMRSSRDAEGCCQAGCCAAEMVASFGCTLVLVLAGVISLPFVGRWLAVLIR